MGYVPISNPLRYFGEREILNIDWRKWYAWRPVKLQCGNWAWLTYIYHRKSKLVITRKLMQSPGAFHRSMQLKKRIYASPADVTIEKLSGKVSYCERMKILNKQHKEGTFEL